MRAAEVLRLYESGRRDFKEVSLRGQNFKGKDLSGADFSGADIRSANFTNTDLTGASFTQAKAGLQRRWVIGLTVVPLLLSILAGVLLALVGFLVALIFDSEHLESQIAGWLSLTVIVVFFFLLLRKGKGIGIGAGALTLGLVLGVAGALALVVANALDLEGAVAGAVILGISSGLALGLVVVIALALAVALAVAVAGTVALALGVSCVLTLGVIGAGTLAGVMATATATAVAGAVAVAVMLVSIYIGWRALNGNERDAWIRSVAIAFAAIGGTSFRGATLTDADFSRACLKSSDFRRSVLLRTRWREAIQLDRVRPGETYLNTPKIRELVITGDGQGQSYNHLLNLVGINLQGANLVNADFTGSNLKDGALQGAKFASASFIGANLNCAYLQDADLSNAKLAQAQLDEADLTGSTLTGACIEDWGITTRTKLHGIRCDYVFMRLLSDRRPGQNPHRKPDDWDKTFADGEFVDFIAPMVQTLDLYHNGKVDPRALAIAYHDLQQKYPEAGLEIISMEKRGQYRDKLLLRAETNPQADLSKLNSQYFERYDYLLTLPPEALQALLIEKDKQVNMLARMVDTAIDQPSHDFRGAQFAGGFAETVAGNQYGGTINNYGPNTEDITRLLAALRAQAQAFPADQKDDANDALDLLERDLAEEQPDPGRIGRRLKKLVAISTTLTVGATAFSADLAQLADVLDVPQSQIEQVQSAQPPSSD